MSSKQRSECDRLATVLVLVGHYRPGYKSGGILRSIENMVDHLHRDFHFRIVTRDRDLGDEQPYSEVPGREWQRMRNAWVYYLQPSDESLAAIRSVVRGTAHDVLYLNSFFEPLTVYALLNRKLHPEESPPVILAPRGEFAWPSLKQKYAKKAVFMAAARAIGLYDGVIWHASSEFEAEDIRRVMKVPTDAIQIASNLPMATRLENEIPSPAVSAEVDLMVVFLARVSPEKNLHYALQVLSRVRVKVVFDIIGPIHDLAYWKRCEEMIGKLPRNVHARYVGTVPGAAVIATLGQYDLFFFPTAGENYAHVIAESLACGTPVLTSTRTPWRNLEDKGLGWDLPLEDPGQFAGIVEKVATEAPHERRVRRDIIRDKVKSILNDPALLDASRRLIGTALEAVPAPDEGGGSGALLD